MKIIMNKKRFLSAALGMVVLCVGSMCPSIMYGAGNDMIQSSGYLVVVEESVWVVSDDGTFEVTNSTSLLQKGAEDGDEVSFKIVQKNGNGSTPIVIVDDLAGRTQPN